MLHLVNFSDFWDGERDICRRFALADSNNKHCEGVELDDPIFTYSSLHLIAVPLVLSRKKPHRRNVLLLSLQMKHTNCCSDGRLSLVVSHVSVYLTCLLVNLHFVNLHFIRN